MHCKTSHPEGATIAVVSDPCPAFVSPCLRPFLIFPTTEAGGQPWLQTD
jgi:hypothetical protein